MMGVPTKVQTRTRVVESEAGARTFFFHEDGAALAMETDLLEWLDLRRFRYPLRRKIRTLLEVGALGEVETVYSAAGRASKGKWIHVLSREQLLTLLQCAHISVRHAALQSVLGSYALAQGTAGPRAGGLPPPPGGSSSAREAGPDAPQVEMVPFAGGMLSALRSQGQGWLVLKPACELLGIDDGAQRRRLERTAWATGSIMDAVGADGRQREMFCLRSDRVAMWLATIDTGRITDPEARQRLETWQCHAADALDAWWRGPASFVPSPALRDFVVATAEQVVQRMHSDRSVSYEPLPTTEPTPASAAPTPSQMSLPDWSAWLSPSQAAELLGVDVRRIQRWLRAQQLEHHRLGARDVRIHPDALQKFIASKRFSSSLN